MNKKLVLLLILLVLTATGCMKLDNNYDNIISEVMNKESNLVNTVSTGYKLYIPQGVLQVTDNENNEYLVINGCNAYLYVDAVSYYYKNSLNYKSSNSYNYYYKELDVDGKTGYVGINKEESDNYYVVVIFNYGKIEFYAGLEDLPKVLANSLIILRSIEYNDTLITAELSSNVSDGMKVKYELDKPVDSESTFSQYLQEYVDDNEADEVALPDSE